MRISDWSSDVCSSDLPHLHYELYRNGRTVNPRSVKFTTVAQLSGSALRHFRSRLSELKSLKAGLPEPMQQAHKTVKQAPGQGQQIAFLAKGTTEVLRSAVRGR